MLTVRNVLSKIGRDNVADALGVGITSISNAAVANKFPASWYVVIVKLSEDAGLRVPRELFGWRRHVIDEQIARVEAAQDFETQK